MKRNIKRPKLSPALLGFAAAGTAGVVDAATPVSENPGAAGTAYPEGGGALYTQLPVAGNGAPDQNFEAAYDVYDSEGADDFTIPGGEIWNITEIFTAGTNAPPPGGVSASVDIVFYEDAGGVPGAPVAGGSFLGVLGTGDTDHTVPVDVTLGPGTYWLGQVTNQDFGGGNGQHFWSNAAGTIGNEAVWRNPGDGFATGCTDFAAISSCGAPPVGGGNGSFLFEVRGTIIPEPSGVLMACITLAFVVSKIRRSLFGR